MDSARLKVARARKHYCELENLFSKKKPFKYFLETNVKTGERATFAKRDQSVIEKAALIVGDIIHNLRAAIDHAYWNCCEHYSQSEGERRSIQFPVTQDERALVDSVLPGLPSRVSDRFSQKLIELRPFRNGGNQMLCAIHDLDILDKHKLLIPTGNFTNITSAMIQKQVPDFPSIFSSASFGNCHRDVAWQVKPMTWTQRRKAKIPPSNILEQELDVPVEIAISDIDAFRPALEVLAELIVVGESTIESLYEAASFEPEQSL